jgi:hypothetical protein
MSLEIGDRVVATALFSPHAAADRNGTWVVSTYAGRLPGRNQAIATMTLVERLAAGFGGGLFVESWREKLFLLPTDSSGSWLSEPRGVAGILLLL